MIKKKNKRGQAAVEYLVTLGIVSVGAAVFLYNKDVQDGFLDAIGSFFNDVVSIQNLPIP